MSNNVPINKGNYSMETIEREKLFEEKRGKGWEKAYHEYRHNWIDYAKQQYVSEYPLLVDIELSSLCNLHCPMCYTITEEFKVKVCTQLMEDHIFKKIVDEIAGKVPAVRLSLRGEPTLHPKLIEYVRYCKENGIKEVSFLTNGSKLTDEYFIELMNAGVDWITISIDGVGQMYESIRKPMRFEDILQKVKKIAHIKKENNRIRPVIKIQGIWPSIRENPTEYYNTFAPYVDLIAFNPLIDYLDHDKDILYEEDFICPQPYQRLVIGSDAKVLLCSNDEDGMQILGDLNKNTIYEIWHGEKLNSIRELHKQGKFTCIDVCKKCYLPRKTEENEQAQVNDRNFVIKNYVNRSQNIGE